VQPLTITPLQDIPLIQRGDSLPDILLAALSRTGISLQDGDVLVITSKIISKAEGRNVPLSTVTPSAAAQELAQRSEKDPRLCELILQESREILRVRPGTVIVEHRLGFVCANAGIDHSNVSGTDEETVLLLPADPQRSAGEIRQRLEMLSGKRLGVMIIDSHGRAWRIGTVGMAIGLSGLPAVVDERGWRDLFGQELKITIVGVADELAAAASLMMGQAAEGTPAVHVRGFPYPLRESSFKELLRPKEQDLFR
jgi:coenzyme F420-0:L-glutamate ligase/coenzyme F420-1:gamma-L-glutamate ligase